MTKTADGFRIQYPPVLTSYSAAIYQANNNEW